MSTRVVGLASLLALVACGSATRAHTSAELSTTALLGSSSSIAPIASSSLTSTTTTAPAGPCTAEDFARVTVLTPPVAHIVTASFGFDLEFGGGWYLDPAPAGVEPKITAEAAWATMRERATPSATGAELWLGMWGLRTSRDPAATSGIQPAVLAWVLRVHHVAESGSFPHPAPAPGMTDATWPICFWAEETTAIDAQTGANLGTSISAPSFP